MKRFLPLLIFLMCAPSFAADFFYHAPVHAIVIPSAQQIADFDPTTWFVRTDGGPRYDVANRPTGDSCDGKGDAAMVVSGGPNQRCAFSSPRYLWDEGVNRSVAPDPTTAWGWVIAGGDLVVMRNGKYRIGWDNGDSNSADNPWCWYAPDPFGSNFGCYNPPIPAGTSGAHTIFESGAVYDGTANHVIPTATYTGSGVQLFGGFGDQAVWSLQGTQWVDMKDIEITTHNGVCSQYGSPSFPIGGSGCVRSVPGASDWASAGILTGTSTANISITDGYIHGMGASALYGPVGGPITLTRVLMNFNVFAGWLFDDGVDNNAAGSTMNARGVWCIGNGALEEYPIVHTQFPAKAMWDDNSNGFGDGCWSGQGKSFVRQWDSFTWIGGLCAYNTKDCGLGPEALVHNLDIEQVESYGNMGAGMKFNTDANATAKYLNNTILGNPVRLSEQIPGAAQSFALSSGLDGAYLSDFGRGSDLFPYSTDAGSSTLIAGNTITGYYPTFFDLSTVGGGNTSTATITFKDNIYVGWTSSESYYPGSGDAPGVYYSPGFAGTLNESYNTEFGMRNGQCPGGTGNVCADPTLTNQPAQGAWPAGTESVFDAYVTGGWYPLTGSPAIHAGLADANLTTDYYGVTRPNPPSMGAVEPASSPSTAGSAAIGLIIQGAITQ